MRHEDEVHQMGQTLMARITALNKSMPPVMHSNAKKDFSGTYGSSVNLMSKATAASYGATRMGMSQTISGVSQFRESTQKGIVSGMGMLTF